MRIESDRLRWVASLAIAALATAVTTVAAQSGLPERIGIVANGTDTALSTERINREFDERLGGRFGLEGLVLMTQSCRPDPEVYLDSALPAYGLATSPGEMNNDALVWMVCEDPRFVGFFYAAENAFADRLDSTTVTEAMKPQLRDGNYTGAIVDGISAVVEQVAGEAGDIDAGGAASGAADGAAEGQPPAGATDGRGRVGTLLFAGAAGAAGVWWWRRSKGRPPARPAATSGPRETLADGLRRLEVRLVPNSTALSRLVLAYETLGDEAVLALNRRHQGMLDRLAELQRQAGALTEGVVGAAMADDPDALAERYREPLAELGELGAYCDELDREAEHVDTLLERAPILVVEARKAMEVAANVYRESAASLGLPEAGRALSTASRLADEAEGALTAGDRITAGRHAENARRIAENLTAIPPAIRKARQAIERAAEAFGRVDDYAPSSWSDIKGNGTEAEESLAAAAGLMQRLVEAATGDLGDDPAAGFMAALDRVTLEIDRAEELSAAIESRLEAIEQARRGAAPQIAAVRGEIAEARAWIAQPAVDPDIDQTPIAGLDRAEAMLADCDAAMAGALPDWPEIARQVQAADRLTDGALAEAREQQQRLIALRRQLETAKSTGEGAVDRVERYLAAHRSDVGGAAASQAADAREALRIAADAAAAAAGLEDVARAAALQNAIDAYEKSGAVADRAYDAMAADVAVAEKNRAPYVPRTEWIGLPRPTASWGSPWSGGFGGGIGRSMGLPSSPGRWGGGSGNRSRSTGSSSRRGGGSGW